jgi:hypothetical protein
MAGADHGTVERHARIVSDSHPFHMWSATVGASAGPLASPMRRHGRAPQARTLTTLEDVVNRHHHSEDGGGRHGHSVQRLTMLARPAGLEPTTFRSAT